MNSTQNLNSALVLLSAGLDSTVNLLAAQQDKGVALALTFDYGQRAAAREIDRAQKLTMSLKIPHKIITLPWFQEFGKSALIDHKINLPTDELVQIDDYAASKNSARAVWVPNRNGILLNIAAGYAESMNLNWVIPGLNREEASTFPDNSGDFLQALNRSFELSTQNKVKVKCYTIEMDKTEIVKYGSKLGLDPKMIWPCYLNGEDLNPQWCRKCESCKRSIRAFESAGIRV